MSQIIDLIKVIPWWPLTVLVLAVIFRSELRGIFERLQHFKYRDFEATFKEGLREAEKEVSDALPETKAAESLSEPTPAGTKQEELMRIAKKSPRAAIATAWREVELAIKEAAVKNGIAVDSNVPLSKVMRELISKGRVPEGFQKVFERLQDLRDQATHAPDFVLGLDETERFIRLALGIAVSLRTA